MDVIIIIRTCNNAIELSRTQATNIFFAWMGVCTNTIKFDVYTLCFMRPGPLLSHKMYRQISRLFGVAKYFCVCMQLSVSGHKMSTNRSRLLYLF